MQIAWNYERAVSQPTDVVFLITCQRVYVGNPERLKAQTSYDLTVAKCGAVTSKLCVWSRTYHKLNQSACSGKEAQKQTNTHVLAGSQDQDLKVTLRLQQTDRTLRCISTGNTSKSELSMNFMNTFIFYSSAQVLQDQSFRTSTFEAPSVHPQYPMQLFPFLITSYQLYSSCINLPISSSIMWQYINAPLASRCTIQFLVGVSKTQISSYTDLGILNHVENFLQVRLIKTHRLKGEMGGMLSSYLGGDYIFYDCPGFCPIL